MRLSTFLYITSSLACICLVTVAQDVGGSDGTYGEILPSSKDEGSMGSNAQSGNTVVGGINATDTAINATDTATNATKEAGETNDNSSGGDTQENGQDAENENDGQKNEKDEKEEVTTDKKDDLNDNPQVVDPDTIADDTDARFHTVKLMLYIIAPVSALVVVYFIMKGLKGNSRMFLNRYHIVGARGDNIELRPLGYESDDEEEDIVFDSSRHT